MQRHSPRACLDGHAQVTAAQHQVHHRVQRAAPLLNGDGVGVVAIQRQLRGHQVDISARQAQHAAHRDGLGVRGPADLQLPRHTKVHDQRVGGAQVWAQRDAQAVQRQALRARLLHQRLNRLHLVTHSRLHLRSERPLAAASPGEHLKGARYGATPQRLLQGRGREQGVAGAAARNCRGVGFTCVVGSMPRRVSVGARQARPQTESHCGRHGAMRAPWGMSSTTPRLNRMLPPTVGCATLSVMVMAPSNWPE